MLLFSHSQNIFSSLICPDIPGRMLLFYLGINIGLISTIISNRREIERLNDTLKHTENLVQDLQEELEMKDSLTVKELDNERLDDSYPNIQDSIDFLQTQVPTSFPSQKTDDKDQPHSKTAEISELSRIEAELEAELERLELNMNAFSLDGRMSALGEVSPKFTSKDMHQFII